MTGPTLNFARNSDIAAGVHLLPALIPHSVLNRDVTTYVSAKGWIQAVVHGDRVTMTRREARTCINLAPWNDGSDFGLARLAALITTEITPISRALVVLSALESLRDFLASTEDYRAVLATADTAVRSAGTPLTDSTFFSRETVEEIIFPLVRAAASWLRAAPLRRPIDLPRFNGLIHSTVAAQLFDNDCGAGVLALLAPSLRTVVFCDARQDPLLVLANCPGVTEIVFPHGDQYSQFATAAQHAMATGDANATSITQRLQKITLGGRCSAAASVCFLSGDGTPLFPSLSTVTPVFDPGIVAAIGRDTPDPLQAAEIFESNGDYSLAIDSYLRAGPEHSADVDALARGWLRAVKLSAMHVRHTLKDALKTAINKLVANDRVEDAANCLEEHEFCKDAVALYVRCGALDQARSLAQRVSPELVEDVPRERTCHPIDNSRTEAKSGDVDDEEKLRTHVSNNDWDQALQLARQMGGGRARAHAALYVQMLLKQKNISKALDMIEVYGVETHDFRFYETFTELGLQACMATPDEAFDLSEIHDGLCAIVEDMKRTRQAQAAIDRSQAVLDVLHIYATTPVLKAAEMPEFAAMLMSSLPRHVGIIPADKAYYDAGTAAKDVEDFGTAFVFFNRYLDVCDKIEDGDPTSESLDNSDFVFTDFPSVFNLPPQLSIQGKHAEDVKDWVLARSVEADFHPSLPTVTEPRTGSKMHVTALRAKDSGEAFEPCAITGQPVFPTLAEVRCKSCNRVAVRSNWVDYISAQQQCPWCKTRQTADAL